ncbi:hypothetical protein K443DRAFT_273213 [Laccaria amethystina LaAM-08-1]|uniref:Uncharacterized protein n=1 Tax=Laccaria amethystina LaAM-08-1 TaxID=1095629 RepID=A0A0C9WW08_9AGAR|nr:hypothetical protein K443DRAFT_273213 [Laccaria amethystina LaAM-08-1]
MDLTDRNKSKNPVTTTPPPLLRPKQPPSFNRRLKHRLRPNHLPDGTDNPPRSARPT